MSLKNFLSSKRVLIFNSIIIAMVAGFGIGVVVLGLNGTWSPKSQVYAEEKPIVVPSSVYDMQNTFRQIAKNVLPSIVEVLTVSTDEQAPEMPETPPFDYFFGPQPKANKGPQVLPKTEGLGSGILVQQNGNTVYVLTNNHVVENANKVTVTLYDKRTYQAKIVGTDPRRDLALVSFQAKPGDQPFVLAKLGNSDELEVGDWVLAIGNPLGLDFTVTSGIVSALGRRGGPNDSINIDSYIQTDASINRGNSGGALVNLRGEVIGINTWIASPNGASVGLGFAIPINSAKRPIQDFIKDGAVQYGWLGASVSDLSPEFASQLGVPSKVTGSFIPDIFLNTPADKAGIEPGDFVIKINGRDIKDTPDLVQTVGDLPIDKPATFTLIREGQEITKTVIIEKRNEKEVRSLKLWPGLAVAPLTADIRSQQGLGKDVQGLIVAQVQDRSTADIAGIKPGDVINKINGTPVTTLKEFYRALNASRQVKISFNRQGVELNIGITR
ncbi:MAG: Do family serine endopeptidase [Spirochaetales bacterium]|nr:Do family serine endopeptidase [Spirochaetales bacterium]